MRKNEKKNNLYACNVYNVFGFSTLQTNAATITNASNLNMPKANYTGTFTENNNSARYYKFTVTTPGCMKVDLVAEFYQRILLLSSTGDEIYHTRISKSYSTGIASVNKDINLEAGSYYIMIEARNSGEYGLYNLSLKYSTFAPAKPSAPYVVSYGNTAVKLSWYKVTDAVGYTIYQKKGSTYKATSTTIQQYRSKYSTGKRKYTFYVVPVKYYNGKYYEGAMSSGKTYTFK